MFVNIPTLLEMEKVGQLLSHLSRPENQAKFLMHIIGNDMKARCFDKYFQIPEITDFDLKQSCCCTSVFYLFLSPLHNDHLPTESEHEKNIYEFQVQFLFKGTFSVLVIAYLNYLQFVKCKSECGKYELSGKTL